MGGGPHGDSKETAAPTYKKRQSTDRKETQILTQPKDTFLEDASPLIWQETEWEAHPIEEHRTSPFLVKHQKGQWAQHHHQG